jgi:hypothetical protein
VEVHLGAVTVLAAVLLREEVRFVRRDIDDVIDMRWLVLIERLTGKEPD